MPQYYLHFCKCHRPALATICDRTPTRRRPPASAETNTSQLHTTKSTWTESAASSSIDSASSITMSQSRDQSTCCFLFPDWLDFAFTSISMRIGGYKTLDDEPSHSRTLNIRFHNEDREWVDHHLRPVVLDELSSIFQGVTFGDKMLHRDAFVFDHFKDDLEASFKTVFVISKSSLADNDFVAMVRQSFQHLNRVRLKKVLLIFLDQPTVITLPYGVRYYVDKNMPYVIWPQDIRKRAYFWKKFVKYTCINKRLNSPLPERCYLQSPWRQ